MNLQDTRNILYVQALEEADEQESVIPGADRRMASSEAGAPLPSTINHRQEDEFFANRAEFLLAKLSGKFPAVAKWLSRGTTSARFGLIALAVILVAAAIGFFTNELGPPGRVNILHFPLIGILLWSLIVYLFELFLLFSSKRQRFDSGIVHGLVNLLNKRQEKPVSEDNPEEQMVAGATAVFENRWRQFLFPIWGAKVKSLLHLTALTLAAAAIAGMYVKGLGNEYTAVWQSTFFEKGEQLRPVLKTVLGPAAAISGGEIPSGTELDEIHLSAKNPEETGENASRWIHWYAITIGMFVILPRLILCLIWNVKAGSLSRNIPFRETSKRYYERLLAISSGKSLPVSVLPYAHKPGEAIRRKVLHTVEEMFNRPIALSWEDAVPFGEEEDLDLDLEDGAQNVLLLFNFSSTPERETHLTLYQSLLKHQATDQLAVFLDAEAFDRKSSTFADAEDRRANRLQSWETLFSGENCDIHVISA